MSLRTQQDSESPRKASTREAAIKVARELNRAGFKAYFAGGCVRDELMGQTPEDYDVATDARPEQVEKIFHRVLGVGASFGVMLVKLMGHTIEVATFRCDGVYSDGRHPDEVTFTDAKHDAMRRDFTINGIFQDPLAEKIIDYVGGQEAIKAGVIQAIGDPEARFREDHLRMLRAIRFAARFGFRIEEKTSQAIADSVGQLEGVSKERIGQEIRKMMLHSSRADAARGIEELGLDQVVLNEEPLVSELVKLSQLIEETRFEIALGAWLLDRHPGDHAKLDVIARQWGKALVLSNEELAGLNGTLEAWRKLMSNWESLRIAHKKRLASSLWFAGALELVRVSDEIRCKSISQEIEELRKTDLAPQAFLDGNDLIDEGLQPGPLFKRVLEVVYDEQLEGAITDRAGAILRVRELEAEGGN